MSLEKLSAVIITFNEEKNIARCIDSIVPVADEIIVLDSYSTDQTASIISKMPMVKLFQREWKGYSDAKNFANSLTMYDYVFSIDADEEVSKELRDSILQLKREGFNNKVYEINRLTNYCGKWIRHCGWYPEYKIRIFKKEIVEWEGIIHEQLVFSTPYTTQKLSGDLNHYSYPTIDSHIKKIITYSTLAAVNDFNSGKKYSFMLHGLLKPFFMFLKKYFLQLGFLDGLHGFVISINSAFERFLRYGKFVELKKNTHGK